MASSDPTSTRDPTVPIVEGEEFEAVVEPAHADTEPHPSPDPTPRPRRKRSDAVRRVDGSSPEDGSDRRPRREPLFAPAKRPGRRVVRIVRHVQLWSVFKVALLAGLVFYAVFLITVGIAWSLANAAGQVHHIEQFMRQIGFDSWSFNGPALFRAAALIGAITLTVGSVLVTLTAAIVNLIAEVTGGIRFTVIESDESDGDDATV